MKTLSIAVPVYNTEKYLRRCLDSILVDEILDEIEVIVVNDGSKDNSVEIMKEYKDKFPASIIMIDKENGGHGSTINAALEVATGKYFKVLDSDDWLDSYNFIELVKELKRVDEDVIVSPYTEEYTYNGFCVPYKYNMVKFNTTIYFDKLKIKDPAQYYFPMASATYKLKILKQCNLKLFEKTFYVDMQYNIMPIPFIKTIRFTNKSIYRYFIGRPTQSMSQENLTRNYLQHQKVLTFLIEYYIKYENDISEPKRKYMEFMAVSMFYTFFNIVCVQMKNKKLSYKTIKKFNEFLKEKSQTLYNATNEYSDLKCSRKLRFLNVRFGMNLYLRIVKLGRKVRFK